MGLAFSAFSPKAKIGLLWHHLEIRQWTETIKKMNSPIMNLYLAGYHFQKVCKGIITVLQVAEPGSAKGRKEFACIHTAQMERVELGFDFGSA
jgi:hypothetical protein